MSDVTDVIAEKYGADVARLVFERRGNPIELRISELELANTVSGAVAAALEWDESPSSSVPM